MKRDTLFGREVALLVKNQHGDWYEVVYPFRLTHYKGVVNDRPGHVEVMIDRFLKAAQHADSATTDPPSVPWEA